MPEISQSAQNYLDDISRQPGARQPATLGEIWDSEWKRGGLDTIAGIGKPFADARAELADAIATAAGRPIEEYAAMHRIPLGGGATVDQNIAALNRLADTLPEESKATIDPLRDVRRRAAQKAQQIEKDAADVSGATYGLGGVATSWAAGIARQTVDPFNLAAMVATAPLGGPVTGRLATVAARQGAAGAVAQAAVEPYVEPARAELGLESGVGRAATNVIQAGIGGAAIGAAGVGISHLFRAAANSYRGARPAVEAAVPVPGEPHPAVVAEDFDAAALHAERDEVTGPAPAADPVTHAEAVNGARRAMEAGEPIPPPAGTVRFYHGGDEYAGGPRWLTPDLEYARGYARGSPVQYVDIPTDSPLLKKSFDDTGTDQVAPFVSFEAPEEIAKGLRRLQEPTIAQPELPLRPPLEPEPAAPAARPEPTPPPKGPALEIGDQALARDVDTRLAALPQEDRNFHVEQPDGTIRAASAKTFLQEITEDAKAVQELIGCIGEEPK